MKKVLLFILSLTLILGTQSCLVVKVQKPKTHDCCKDVPKDSCGLFQSEFE